MLRNWRKTRQQRDIFSTATKRHQAQARRWQAAKAPLWSRILPRTVASQRSLLCLLVLAGLGYLFSQQSGVASHGNSSSATQRQSVPLPGTAAANGNSVTRLTAKPVATEPQLATAPPPDGSTEPDEARPTVAAIDATNAAAAESLELTARIDLGPQHRYQVQSGDTLSAIFDRFNLSQKQMYQVLEADYSVLALDTLMPGNQLNFWVDAEGLLTKFEIEFDRSHQVVFAKAPQGFEVNEVLIDGQWQSQSIGINIQGSFSRSAQRAGLRSALANQIHTMFKDKLDFRRRLRAGDTVRVLLENQSIDGNATGNSRLLAVEFEGRNWQHTAYLHSDGNYYDADGASLARAFMRHPFAKSYRISSKYNPRRLHPVTKRVSPHNGTDYAAGRGTPILAAGDGVVKRVENHPIAGKYVVLQHGGEYRTRYLHMSRIDVRRGQTVVRGQKIGAVGSTGRVTGAHLHYEFHIRGRAVNSLTAKIPMATSVEKQDKQQFLAQVYLYQTQMQEMLAKQMGVEGGNDAGEVIVTVAD
ncbi:peptidoglycan DD-metalloendopeptidase family protein [uncultured Ferrimonas sp.]|uniref:peptidoglycan DD-metalloendopeptidase family protein n=1 Tax=uncultured Ferrimonas sp. TaxID=432640 RepID=UPI0026295D98|nr:peptidoglycan DD-metalloendopeptidase family protein [uncultured Ferrimonas sp.]